MWLEQKTYNKYSKKINYKNNLLKKGKFGFKVKFSFRIKKSQYEALYFLLVRKIKLISKNKLKSKIWSNIYFNKNLTKLSSESRMGKGKGSIYTQAAFIKSGTIIFELENINSNDCQKVFFYLKSQLKSQLILINK